MIIRIKKIEVSLLLGVGLVILSSCDPGSTIKYSQLTVHFLIDKKRNF
jgi:hypothetical protein